MGRIRRGHQQEIRLAREDREPTSRELRGEPLMLGLNGLPVCARTMIERGARGHDGNGVAVVAVFDLGHLRDHRRIANRVAEPQAGEASPC